MSENPTEYDAGESSSQGKEAPVKRRSVRFEDSPLELGGRSEPTIPDNKLPPPRSSVLKKSRGKMPVAENLCQSHCPQVAVGVQGSPATTVVGGNELEDFLVEERNPLICVGPEVRRMATQQNLLQPEPFSTAKLMARLKEIEQETFSLEAALRVAKLRGIELDEEDEKDLRKALEEERKLQVTADRHNAPQAKCKTNGVRYTQLTKISDPRVSHSGPVLAPRKVRKQVDPKWKDMRTMKPALSDLWDLKYTGSSQVCSSGAADIDHNAVYRAFDRDDEDGEVYARREVTCRHAWSSQALYDGCSYKPDEHDSHIIRRHKHT